MKNREALVKAREIIEVNLKAQQTPRRGDVAQLTDGYAMLFAIRILKNLEKQFGEDE